MNCLLVVPYIPSYIEYQEFYPNLALLYLTAALRQGGHHPTMLDLNVYHPLTKEDPDCFCTDVIISEILRCNPKLIGFSCLFSGHFPIASNIAQNVKHKFPDIEIVFGGIHPTLFAKKILKHCSWIDYVVIGEGERQAVALADAIEKGEKDKLVEIEAFACRCEDGKILVNSDRASFIKSLDDLPCPAYDLLELEKYYHDLSHWFNPKGLSFKMTMPILTSRSCPFKCNFCSMWHVMGSSIRNRNPILVVDQIQMLYNEYGLNHFSFVDDNITLNKRHVLGICEEISKRKLNIQFETPNGVYINSLNAEVIDAMVDAGWVRGALAIEHGDDYIRNDIIGKNLRREKIFEVVDYCKTKRDKLFMKVLFIMGFPEDTQETLMETYRMISELGIDRVFICNLLPYPGTRVYDQAVKEHLFVDDLNVENLWRESMSADGDLFKFYIKPYRMSINELVVMRKKFNDLIAGTISGREKHKRESECT